MPITLWRPTGQAERDLVAGSGWREWPPRLPDQPIFYPVANRWYATKIAREWFLGRYPVQQAGGREVLEHWAPAEGAVEHPGIALLGDDGGRERFAIDVRRPDSPVYLVQITSTGWSDALPLADSVEAFIASIEDGSLAYH